MESRAQAQGSNYRGPGWDSRAGGSRNQEGWQGRWPPDPRGCSWLAQDQRRPPGRQERQDQGGKQQAQIPPKPLELRERLNLAKEKKDGNEKPDEDPRKIKCFRCQEYGHHQKDCENSSICYKCKEEGHMAAECNDFHSKGGDLKKFGFAIPEQGFYNIKIPGEGASAKASSIIQVLQGEANEKKIAEELKNLINNKWDWQVKQVEDKEFTVIFPDKGTLDTFSKISEILMSVHGIKVKIFKASFDPDAVEMLQTTWIKIYGISGYARKEKIVMKVAALAGEPLVVDELSLIHLGPVRVKINGKDPLKLRGFVRIFFNMPRHNIRFVSKNYKDKASVSPPPPPSNDDDLGDEDEGGDDSEEDSDKKHKIKSDKESAKRGLTIEDRSGRPGGSSAQGTAGKNMPSAKLDEVELTEPVDNHIVDNSEVLEVVGRMAD
jgi:hypothetical protein